MVTRKICSIPGCPDFVVHRSRCAPHAAQLRRQRGTTTAQGYGWAHQQRRARLIPDAIGTPCPCCGRLMTDPSQMDAAHSVALAADPTSKADTVWCAHCNRSEGGRLAHTQ